MASRYAIHIWVPGGAATRAAAMVPLQRPPGSGLRFVIVSRLASTPLVRFKVDVSAADVIVGKLDS